MFDKTIGSYNLIFSITPTGTPTLVKSLLSGPDLAELNAYLYDPVDNIVSKIVVDGYLTGTATFYVSHKNGGAEETIAVGERYPLPVYSWPDYVYIRGSGTIKARMLLSRI